VPEGDGQAARGPLPDGGRVPGRPGAGQGRAAGAAGPAAAGAATAAMATTVLPPLAGYPARRRPRPRPSAAGDRRRAARHAGRPGGPRAGGCTCWCRWGGWPWPSLVAFMVSRLVDDGPRPRRRPRPCPPPPGRVVETTALQTSTSQLPTTSRLPTTTAPPTTAPTTTQQQPGQVQVPDVIGRRPAGARAQLEAAGLQVNQQQVPVRDPQQDGRVVQQPRRPAPPCSAAPPSLIWSASASATAADGRLIATRPDRAVRGHRLHRPADRRGAGRRRARPVLAGATGPGWRPWPARLGGLPCGRGRHAAPRQRPRPRRRPATCSSAPSARS
jgi:hypothetical protein